MSLSNWSDLQSTLNNWLGTNFYADQYGTWARLIEARVDRELRTRHQESTSTLTLSAAYIDLESDPADWLEFGFLELATDPPCELQMESPQNYARFRDDGSGTPRWFHFRGNRIYFRPAPDGTYTLNESHYEKIDGLEANSTNWLMTNHPDVYLFGMLTMAADFKRDDGATIPLATAKRWSDNYERAWAALAVMDQRARSSGSLPQIQTDVAAV
jgi:hypothetical protein